jgi:hypothetical protein
LAGIATREPTGSLPPWPAQLLASVACPRGHGPQQSAALGQFGLGTKSSASVFFPEIFQNNAKTCLIHRIFYIYPKNMYDLSKCSEKHALHFSIKIMHV